MSIKIKYSTASNCIIIHTEHHGVKELKLKEKFYSKILFNCFGNKKVFLLTISPQAYSLGRSLGKNYERKVSKTHVLVTEIDSPDADLFATISEGEEFSRTLLFIVACEIHFLTTEISSIIEMIETKFKKNSVTSTVAYCEDDGENLHLINPDRDVENLRLL